MSEATFTIPGPILDMLAQGLREMRDAPRWVITHGRVGTHKVWMKTDAGDELTFLRAPDMERT